MSSRRLIRKYANRRLYDTEQSRHVTLADIRSLIVSGVDVAIVEDASDKDITRQILLQIINDQEQKGEPLFSESLLMQMIRFYGNPMQSMMSSYLEKSMDTFVRQNAAMQEQFQSMLSASPMANMQEMMVQNMAAWQRMFGTTGETSAESSSGNDEAEPKKPGRD